ncbi:SLATT domain-containing protein [Novosphingobium humi]|uniref:SLATT domain-containing protein n=1 Tax=Novosphingobium humi TaxID=2282397 RepID=UPI0025B03B75|nr:SLATT domain-containing protein [Novosphingobium humi]WJS99303.1 SLATT domain-containing protein [Novosphingobium humi]
MDNGAVELFKVALKDFQRSVEITRDVRFQANLRLMRRQERSAYMVSFLSLYVIALSLLPNVIEIDPHKNQLLLACSVILSVFVIFTSLIDGSQNFYHQGELLHRCARQVATVYHELKNIQAEKDLDAAWHDLRKLQSEYRHALDECPVNHANCDFSGQKARKPHLFPIDYGKNFHFLKRAWFYLHSWLGPNMWMWMHLAAIGAISVIVYIYVLKGSGSFGLTAK